MSTFISGKTARSFLFLIFLIPVMFVAGMVLLMHLIGQTPHYDRMVTLANATAALLLTAMLATMALLSVLLNASVAESNEKLAEVAAQQHAMSKAEIQVREWQGPETPNSWPGVSHAGEFRFVVVNKGWKDSAVDRVLFIASTASGAETAIKVQVKERGATPQKSELMVRSGDRRVFYGQLDGMYLEDVETYTKFRLIVQPVVGETVEREMIF